MRAQQDKSRAGVPPVQRALQREQFGSKEKTPTSSARAGETHAPPYSGFTAFICWTFQAGHTKLKVPTVGAHEYLRTQALGWIYLDNFTNIQSSWVTQGQEIGQVALKFGG